MTARLRSDLVAHACFDCRTSFKRAPTIERTCTCPNCGRFAHQMGRGFRAPKRDDVEQWMKVRVLFAHGFRFLPDRDVEHEPFPERLRDVAAFMAANPGHPFRVAAPRLDLLEPARAPEVTPRGAPGAARKARATRLRRSQPRR